MMGKSDDSGAYVKCTICGKFDFSNRHKCPPKWEVDIPDWWGEWQEVYALDEEDAAKESAEQADCGEIEVLVRKPGTADVKKFACSAKAELTYYAKEVPNDQT